MKPFVKRSDDNSSKYFLNHQIRAPKVLCIDDEVNHGIISLQDALRLAESKGLDLVQISAQPGQVPTAKILDYSKFKYEQAKKDKLSKKKQRESAIEIKEIKFRPSTAENDLRTKARQAQGFLEEGNKVKISIVFHGRELSHKEVADNTLQIFLSLIPEAQIVSPASLNGKDLIVIIEKRSSSSDKAKSA
jgi:translation initiation factor IF-3